MFQDSGSFQDEDDALETSQVLVEAYGNSVLGREEQVDVTANGRRANVASNQEATVLRSAEAMASAAERRTAAAEGKSLQYLEEAQHLKGHLAEAEAALQQQRDAVAEAERKREAAEADLAVLDSHACKVLQDCRVLRDWLNGDDTGESPGPVNSLRDELQQARKARRLETELEVATQQEDSARKTLAEQREQAAAHRRQIQVLELELSDALEQAKAKENDAGRRQQDRARLQDLQRELSDALEANSAEEQRFEREIADLEARAIDAQRDLHDAVFGHSKLQKDIRRLEDDLNSEAAVAAQLSHGAHEHRSRAEELELRVRALEGDLDSERLAGLEHLQRAEERRSSVHALRSRLSTFDDGYGFEDDPQVSQLEEQLHDARCKLQARQMALEEARQRQEDPSHRNLLRDEVEALEERVAGEAQTATDLERRLREVGEERLDAAMQLEGAQGVGAAFEEKLAVCREAVSRLESELEAMAAMGGHAMEKKGPAPFAVDPEEVQPQAALIEAIEKRLTGGMLARSPHTPAAHRSQEEEEDGQVASRSPRTSSLHASRQQPHSQMTSAEVVRWHRERAQELGRITPVAGSDASLETGGSSASRGTGRRRAADEDTPSHNSLPAEFLEVMANIDQVGWSNMQWQGGHTMLHWASKKGNVQLVKRFLAQRADPDKADDRGKSSLDYAREANASNVLLVLERARAGIAGRGHL